MNEKAGEPTYLVYSPRYDWWDLFILDDRFNLIKTLVSEPGAWWNEYEATNQEEEAGVMDLVGDLSDEDMLAYANKNNLQIVLQIHNLPGLDNSFIPIDHNAFPGLNNKFLMWLGQRRLSNHWFKHTIRDG